MKEICQICSQSLFSGADAVCREQSKVQTCLRLFGRCGEQPSSSDGGPDTRHSQSRGMWGLAQARRLACLVNLLARRFDYFKLVQPVIDCQRNM